MNKHSSVFFFSKYQLHVVLSHRRMAGSVKQIGGLEGAELDSDSVGSSYDNRILFPLASRAVIYIVRTCHNMRGLLVKFSSQRRIVSSAHDMLLPLPLITVSFFSSYTLMAVS